MKLPPIDSTRSRMLRMPMPRRGSTLDGRHVEADAVVDDAQAQAAGMEDETDLTARRARASRCWSAIPARRGTARC